MPPSGFGSSTTDMRDKGYTAPARDLAAIDSDGSGVKGTNNDYTGSLITQGSGQCTFTIGVALSASGNGNSLITGFNNDGSVFNATSNCVINLVQGNEYGAVGGGTVGGEEFKIVRHPWMADYDYGKIQCLFKLENASGGAIAADKTFVVNFVFF